MIAGELKKEPVLTRAELMARVMPEIPPSYALRTQSTAARDQWVKRRKGRDFDANSYRAVPSRQQPLEARIETGRRLMFRRTLNQMLRRGSIRVLEVDGQRVVELIPKRR